MEVINNTKLLGEVAGAKTKEGLDALVIAVKGTWSFPEEAGQLCKLSKEPVPLIDSDLYLDEGATVTLQEYDFAPIKPKCDVILNGHAYAPNGEPTKECVVGLDVAGQVTKKFTVKGNRYWKRSLGRLTISEPEPFVKQTIDYGCAFGGIDASKGEDKTSAFNLNYAGRGFCKGDKESLINQPAPHTEELNKPISNTTGPYQPMSFGCVGRAWQPRLPLAGTYDQNWVDNISPFLPDDFDNAFFQSAPLDQQMDYLQGGETVLLYNLTPNGTERFSLPKQEVHLTIKDTTGELINIQCVADTLVIEPDERRFSIVWRYLHPMKRNQPKIDTLIIGEPTPAWLRARAKGKRYRSMRHLSKFS